MQCRAVLLGLALWLCASVALRLGGQYLLPPGDVVPIVLLLAGSAVLLAVATRALASGLAVPREDRAGFAIAFAAPSLVLDAVASALFPFAYPNLPAGAAGVFGGWILACCAGALVGMLVR